MALDSQKGFPGKMVMQHNAASSKFYQKIVIVLFIFLQVICGFLIRNFYNDFLELESQVSRLELQLDELRVKVDLTIMQHQPTGV